MARSPISGTTLLALCALGTFAYGVEHWRGRASSRAVTEERITFDHLALCMLGPDGEALIARPGDTRRRLRALAMATSLTPAPTWLDRCVPFARTLATRGSAVDVTRRVGTVSTRVGERAHQLARELARVGIVWQVRAGDPEADMDRLADLFARTADEIGLADGHANPTLLGTPSTPVAPRPWTPPRTARLAITGLVPLPLGTPVRFLVGAPLPLASTVAVNETGLRVEAVANVDAHDWRQTPQGLVRIVSDHDADGLAQVLFDGPSGRLGTGRIAAPPAGTDRSGVAIDATSADGVLWLAEAIRAQPPTLCRLAPGTAATAARLGPAPTEVPPASRNAPDDEIAVGTDGSTVLAAFTQHSAGASSVRVSLVRATGGARAAVEAVAGGTWQVEGWRPRLAFCRGDDTTWLVATGRGAWQAGIVRGRSLVSAPTVMPPEGHHWEEAVTVRCAGDRAWVYGREHPRTSPVLVCTTTAAGPVCEARPAPPSPQPADMVLYATGGIHGEQTVHAEWPFAAVAMADGAIVAARAAGTMVAVSRLDPGATVWRPERVMLDAAADEHGTMVTGVELYTAAARVLLVMSTASEVLATASDDGGGGWEAP